MVQTVYNIDNSPRAPGMKGDIGPDYVRSYKNTTGAVVPFGVVVALGDADDKMKRLTGPTDKLLGIVVHSHDNNSAASLLPGASATAFGAADTVKAGVPIATPGNVMRLGLVSVAVEAAVACEGRVYARVAAGAGGTEIGALRGDSDSGTAVRLAGARFASSTSAAGIADVYLEGQLSYSPDAAATGGILAIGVVSLVPSAKGAASANAFDVVGAILNTDGSAVTATRVVNITSWAPTADQGDLAAATVAVGTTPLFNNPATGDNNGSIISTAAGLFSFKVTNTAAETTTVIVEADGCIPRVIRLT